MIGWSLLNDYLNLICYKTYQKISSLNNYIWNVNLILMPISNSIENTFKKLTMIFLIKIINSVIKMFKIIKLINFRNFKYLITKFKHKINKYFLMKNSIETFSNTVKKFFILSIKFDHIYYGIYNPKRFILCIIFCIMRITTF